MKKCRICQQDLPLDHFGKWSQSPDGYKIYCKSCIARQRRQARETNGLTVHKILSSPPVGMMVCPRCEQVKDISRFPSNSTGLNRYRAYCKDCRAEYQREYARKKGIVEKRKRDPLLIAQGLKECFHCGKVLSLSEFSPANRGWGGVAAYCKSCQSKRAMRDKKLHAEKVRKWRENSPIYPMQHSAYMQKRRAKKKGQDTGKVTTAFMRSLYSQLLCVYCGREVPVKERTIDHIIPLNKGGLHDPDNLAMCCNTCNSSKGDSDLIDFLERLKSNGVRMQDN